MNAIEVKNVSKMYRLGRVSTGSLAHDINRLWHQLRGKEDPYFKIATENAQATANESEYVWSLRDISFELKEGEVLGIIGRNGAGKSTLLKILSRVTGPTSGEVRMRGRVASLLEVGTGFHPELTGRENLFLNGAILGMTKREIAKRFDEIVDFSGVERYIDTPVKRYSSGMYVRLAFAVAAHLEPEILIVDEVLAVGDTEFQRKCLGKMKDVSGHGRTVLFVSHNMNSIARLCTNGLVLQNGATIFSGNITDAIAEYTNRYLLDDKINISFSWNMAQQEDKDIRLLLAEIRKISGEPLHGVVDVREPFFLYLKIQLMKYINRPKITFHFKNKLDEFVWFCDINDVPTSLPHNPGIYHYRVRIPQPFLKPETYFVHVGIVNVDSGQTNHFPNLFKVELTDYQGHRGTRAGYLYTETEWELIHYSE